jgi:superfamily II DNA helicase RecQ
VRDGVGPFKTNLVQERDLDSMEYKLITADCSLSLQKEVTYALAEGWELHGGPFAKERYYCQVMIKNPLLNEKDSRLFSALTAVRSTLKGSRPITAMITDNMLYEVVARKPQTLSELAQIRGFNSVKMALCGEAFVFTIWRHR